MQKITYRIVNILAWVLLLGVTAGCNRGELLHVKNQMEENIETAKRIEQMRVQLVIDFQNAATLYTVMEKKLYVTQIQNNANGTYTLVYSDGSELVLRNGFTPLVSLGADMDVIINGESTGLKPGNGENGRLPVISIDHDGFYWVDGVKTDIKGIAGPDGQSLQISIDGEGYYCVDGTRVQPEINLKGTDGTDGSKPVPTIVLNVTENRYELLIDGEPTNPRTFVSPTDGIPGSDGADAGNYIRQVVLSPDDELVFTFADGSVQKSSPVSLSDLVFELDMNRVDHVMAGETRRVGYTLKTDYQTNPVSVMQYQEMKGWKIVVGQPNPLTKKGVISLTAAAGGLTADGVLLVKAFDKAGKSIIRRIELETESYRIAVPLFAESNVYQVRTPQGVKIAEVCKEYNPDADMSLTVVYPCDSVSGVYGAGYVVDNGGNVNHSGLYYTAGTKGRVTVVECVSGKITDRLAGGTGTVVRPDKVSDIDGNAYRVVKIGNAYWMMENLRTEHYRNGKRILERRDEAVQWGDNGAFCYYGDRADCKSVFGALYNGYALQSKDLPPVGWRVSTDKDWEKLTEYVRAFPGMKLKTTVLSPSPALGEWMMVSGVISNNITGFGGLPGGTYLHAGGVYRDESEAGYWAGVKQVYSMKYDKDILVTIVLDKDSYYSARCVREIIEDYER